MSVRMNAVQVCDRCLKPYNETHLKEGDTVPSFKRQGLRITSLGETSTVLVEYEDICESCHEAVQNLIEKIKLEASAAKKKPAKRRRPRSKAAKELSEEESTVSAPVVPEDEVVEAKPKVDAEDIVDPKVMAAQIEKVIVRSEEELPAAPKKGNGTPVKKGNGKAKITKLTMPVEEVAEDVSEESSEEKPKVKAAAPSEDVGEYGIPDEFVAIDMETLDVYDNRTGEIIGSAASDADTADSADSAHPF